MPNFEFSTAQQIRFGPGTVAQATSIAASFGRRPLVVTGQDPSRADFLLHSLAGAGLSPHHWSVAGEPSTDDITRGLAAARNFQCDCVIGMGGGSAMDAAKAISALLTNNGELLDYLEIIGRAQTLALPSAPCIAIPTTSGTGAEVTRNAVLSSTHHRLKVSFRSIHLLPRVAIVDPELTHSLPASITASSGLDALTQLIEPYVSSRANPFTDAFCVEGLRRVSRSLRTVVQDGKNAAAREDMSLASVMGGLALANAGLGAVHGFAGPIGGMFNAPHGAICGVLLPHVFEVNFMALRARSTPHAAIIRYEEVSRLLTDKPHATALDGARWIQELVSSFQLPRLSHYGVTPAQVPAVVEAAAQASSMKANPLPLTRDELTEILTRAM
jgi:alcohol dehydrogenase class IV